MFMVILSIFFIFTGISFSNLYAGHKILTVIGMIFVVSGGAVSLPHFAAARTARTAWRDFYQNQPLSAALVKQELDSQWNNERKYGLITAIVVTIMLLWNGASLFIASVNPTFLIGDLVTAAVLWGFYCLKAMGKNKALK